MKASTELFLYELEFFAGTFLRYPSHSRMNESFESWSRRNGLAEHIATLLRQKYLEVFPGDCIPGEHLPLDRIIRLTTKGRIHAAGGRHPPTAWDRDWDGRWRYIVFDLPTCERALRMKLWRYLTGNRFGHLQLSVWLNPFPLTELCQLIAKLPRASGSFTCLEGRPVAGETDPDMVRASWPFGAIKDAYEHYLFILDTLPAKRSAIPDWIAHERDAWREAIHLDPLLPRALNPPGYLGYEAWARRQEMLLSVSKTP